jgi:hypothetical protein
MGHPRLYFYSYFYYENAKVYFYVVIINKLVIQICYNICIDKRPVPVPKKINDTFKKQATYPKGV